MSSYEQIEQAANDYAHILEREGVEFDKDAFITGARWHREQSGWISVKDRLPENTDTVLICCADMLPPVIRTAEFQPSHNSWYRHSALIESKYITHWKPTEPPKQ